MDDQLADAKDGKGRTPLALAVKATVDSYWTDQHVAQERAVGIGIRAVDDGMGTDERGLHLSVRRVMPPASSRRA